MRSYLLLIICVLLTCSTVDTFAKKRGKRSKSNSSYIYVSKKYKGHKCPKPRQIMNAKYF